jgi:16S rRNA (guanine(966)-N(2))-methyltransferase RsmD
MLVFGSPGKTLLQRQDELMRVIGGTARGRRLVAFKGENIRPTTDRVREALFSMLFSRRGSLDGLRVLDIFAGSGALGIEALSRGAATACFIDSARQAGQTIRENLDRCGFAKKAQVIEGDALKVLQNLSGKAPFDLIFMDPPYGQDWATRALESISASELLAGDGLICLETGINDPVPERSGDLYCADQRRYGSTMVHFYHKD